LRQEGHCTPFRSAARHHIRVDKGRKKYENPNFYVCQTGFQSANEELPVLAKKITLARNEKCFLNEKRTRKGRGSARNRKKDEDEGA
jgi:hypothetical protein